MSAAATFNSFEAELGRLVETFGRNLAAYKGPGYDDIGYPKLFTGCQRTLRKARAAGGEQLRRRAGARQRRMA